MKKIALTFSLLLSACVAHGDGSGAIEETSGNNLVFERYELDCGADPEGTLTLNFDNPPVMTIYYQGDDGVLSPYDLVPSTVENGKEYSCPGSTAKFIFVLVRPE